MSISNKTILIISPEPWGINFVSKHHYASLLVEKGNKVFFLNPPSDKMHMQTIKENLYIIDYQVNVRGVNSMPAFVRNFLNKRLINTIKKQFIKEALDIVWSFDPYRFQNLNAWDATTRIYHSVDVHATDLEKDAVESADIVFATSDLILEKYKNWAKNTPKIKINHGVAAHFLSPIIEKVADFRKPNYKAHVGYIGNLNIATLDYNLLLKLVADNTDIAFYFIGPYKGSNLSQTNDYAMQIISQIQQLPNAIFLGAKPSKELPSYMQYLDMFLMVYRGDEFKANLANPHKTLEYLSTGKVALSCYIDEYKDKRSLLQMANTNAEIPTLFRNTVDHLEQYNTPTLQAKRQAYTQTQSYAQQLERIAKALANLKTSV